MDLLLGIREVAVIGGAELATNGATPPREDGGTGEDMACWELMCEATTTGGRRGGPRDGAWRAAVGEGHRR